jgi:hypothetical protein
MRELVAEQQKNVEQAFVMESGPYRVISPYKHLTKSSTSRMKLGKISREKHLHKIHTFPLHLSSQMQKLLPGHYQQTHFHFKVIKLLWTIIT